MQSSGDKTTVDIKLPQLLGKTVGRFAIRLLLGRGGFGEVYLAEDTTLKRLVALKRLSPTLRDNADYRKRLLTEAERVSSLNHPNIAAIYDIVEENGEFLLVMEYVDGGTLNELLVSPLPLAQFFELGMQFAQAMAVAHDRGIVHCDLKPENIMLASSGRLKVLDFGVAREVFATAEALPSDSDPDASPRGHMEVISGTPAYLAPEIFTGSKPDTRTDVFAMGIVFFQMLSGQHPFLKRDSLGNLRQASRDSHPKLRNLNAVVPAELESLIDAMLEPDRERRLEDARQVLMQLRAIESSRLPAARTLESTRAELAALLPKDRGRRRWLIAVAFVFCAGLAIVGVTERERIAALLQVSKATEVPLQKQIAVLPFRNLGSDPAEAAFAQGLAETISAKLMQLTVAHPIQVASAGEVNSLKVATIDDARRELGVNLVFEGSVHRLNDTSRVALSLVDVTTKRQLRSEVITLRAATPLNVEEEVVAAAVRMLELQLHSEEREALRNHGTVSGPAYELFVKGKGYLQTGKPEDTDSAIAEFTQATTLDPHFADGYAALGAAYFSRYRAAKDPADVGRARAACDQALAVEPGNAEGHACRGTVLYESGKYEAAASELQLTLAADPANDWAYRSLGNTYRALNRNAEAEQLFKRGIQVRPQNALLHAWLGTLYAAETRYAESNAELDTAIKLMPEGANYWYALGGLKVMTGDYDAAVAALQHGIAIRPTYEAYSNLGEAYFSSRKFPQAIEALEQSVNLGGQQTVTYGNLARAYYWAPGQRSKAEKTFETAFAHAERDLKVNPNDADAHLLAAHYAAMLGKRAIAERHLSAAVKLHPEDAETAYFAAIIETQFQNKAAAFSWLEKAAARGYSRQQIASTIEFDPLRSDPRFQKVLAR